jgi:RimJ/RimL family protein N-acetyltransferase
MELEMSSPPGDSVWLTAEVIEGNTPPVAIGMAGLWGIDQFNRRAHISLTLLPEWRGKDYGTELLTTLCRYAFHLRGLRRLEVETLSRNVAMQSLARRCGFKPEGCLRQRDHDAGRWTDVLLYGLLDTEMPSASLDRSRT